MYLCTVEVLFVSLNLVVIVDAVVFVTAADACCLVAVKCQSYLFSFKKCLRIS